MINFIQKLLKKLIKTSIKKLLRVKAQTQIIKKKINLNFLIKKN